MANPRARFNELVLKGKFERSDYPEVQREGELWRAFSRKFATSATLRTKVSAIDAVLERMMEGKPKSYCCPQKCFVVPSDQVDGIACRRCCSFSFCRCSCVEFAPLLARSEMRDVFVRRIRENTAAQNEELFFVRGGEYSLTYKMLGKKKIVNVFVCLGKALVALQVAPEELAQALNRAIASALLEKF